MKVTIIDESASTGPKRTRGKRKYVLECRYLVDKLAEHGWNPNFWMGLWNHGEWHKHRAYRTERARDEAMKRLSNVEDYMEDCVEYRIPEEEV